MNLALEALVRLGQNIDGFFELVNFLAEAVHVPVGIHHFIFFSHTFTFTLIPPAHRSRTPFLKSH